VCLRRAFTRKLQISGLLECNFADDFIDAVQAWSSCFMLTSQPVQFSDSHAVW
jgi:hypothetical protein